MHEHEGILLIGGARLDHVHCELEEEIPVPNSNVWNLAGHMHVAPTLKRLLELNRRYLLQLDDGRYGAVAITRISHEDERDLELEFHSR